MKKITYLLLITLSAFVFNSCSDDIDGTNELDYVGLTKLPASISVEKNGSTSVELHLYATQTTGADRTFNIIVLPATTLNPAAYSMPSTIVIPANSKEGVITVTFSDTNLGETPKTFVIQLEGNPGVYVGGKTATTVTKKCSIAGVSNLVGAYKVTTNTSGKESKITTQLDGANLKIFDLGKSMMTGWWGEDITDGGTCTISVNLTTGALTIPRQYFMTTDYKGDISKYEIQGSGKWNNCGASPTLTLTYDVYYKGDKTGIGNDYLGKAFGGVFTKE
ncbi:MAG: hypothetical protein ACOH1N_05185 [Lutibacter sp.]